MSRWRLCNTTFFTATLAGFLAGAALAAQTPTTPAARLEIRAVDGGPFPTEEEARQSVNGALPANEEIVPNAGNHDGSSDASYYVIERSAIVAGSDFLSAQPGVNSNTGQSTVNFTLTREAGDKFFAYTSANIGKSMAVVMGGTVRESAVIKSPIRDRGMFTGFFSRVELMELTEAFAAQQVPATQTLPSGHPNEPYWTEHDRQLLVDFGGLAHFKEANAMLGAAKTGEDRVVFMGDSITQGWKLDQSFPGKPYVNRGISGQTTPQMLIRFRQDAIDLKPKVVVILAGTNDIAGNTGPMTLEQTEGNIASMAELAAANGIRVVLCSVLPAYDYHWAPGLTPAPKIAQVNAWLRDYAAQKGYVYVDFYSAMKDERGGLPATLSADGVHPLPAGYAVMSPLAEAGIEKALKK
ncbi:MAG: GDSL-type esterase/lipase family protein [Terracidiphilus sp.]|nr:GDSL-type esterase/lipase family protein [Terracidiphilus sp.]MDR3798166.1 GDSL-type esterase/lipase family protein [Terracidiphilus sp.]